MKKRHVTNNEFVKELDKPENKAIIFTVTRKFFKVLDEDERRGCGLAGLWKTLAYHIDGKGNKWSTSLYGWTLKECIRELKSKQKNRKNTFLVEDFRDDNFYYKEIIRDIILDLSSKERELFIQYFIERRTLKNVGEINGYSKESARTKINRIKRKIKGTRMNDFMYTFRQKAAPPVNDEGEVMEPNDALEAQREDLEKFEKETDERNEEAAVKSAVQNRLNDARKIAAAQNRPLSEVVDEMNKTKEVEKKIEEQVKSEMADAKKEGEEPSPEKKEAMRAQNPVQKANKPDVAPQPKAAGGTEVKDVPKAPQQATPKKEDK